MQNYVYVFGAAFAAWHCQFISNVAAFFVFLNLCSELVKDAWGRCEDSNS